MVDSSETDLIMASLMDQSFNLLIQSRNLIQARNVWWPFHIATCPVPLIT